MPTVTVLAPDSALAMDEVIRQLGDNAYILATHTRDGQVEILATTEPAQIQPPRKRVTSVSFADVISEQVAQGASAAASFKSRRADAEAAEETPSEQAPIHSAVIVALPQARTRLPVATPVANTDDLRIETTKQTIEETVEDSVVERLYAAVAEIDAPPTPPQQVTDPAPSTSEQTDADLRPLLRELAAQLARLEATSAPQAHHDESLRDPLEAAGFSSEIVKSLAPGRAARERVTQFVTAMAKTLVTPDPLKSLRAPVVVIVGPSGSGKTVLAGKIAALALENEKTRSVELVSLSETPPLVDRPLQIYARMLSIRHSSWQPDQFEPSQLSTQATTRVFDTNLDPEILRQKLTELRAEIGRTEVAVIIALPVGISPARARAELLKYKDLDPIIALTKLDEFELSPEEASQIAETGTQIAWLSGTRALTETIAPATEEMMSEFLTGLLAARS